MLPHCATIAELTTRIEKAPGANAIGPLDATDPVLDAKPLFN
jgi:hypothetical protein